MSDLANQVTLVALGWLLGVLSQGVERRWQEYLEKRRVLTRLDRILTALAIELEVSRQLGASRTTLPEPPMLPEDFDRVVDQLGDWEARRGDYWIHYQLLTLKRLVDLAREGHAILEGKDGVPESQSRVYDQELREVNDKTWRLINCVHDAQLGLIGQIKKRLRRKTSEKLGTRAVQEEQAQPLPPNPAAPADQKASLPGR